MTIIKYSMGKILRNIAFMCLILFAIPSMGQQEGVPEKETVIIDYFSRVREVPGPYMEALRARVIEGFVNRGRHRVVDAQTIADLRDAGYGMVSSPSAIINNQRDAERRRADAIRSLGARYVVSGAVTKCSFKRDKVGDSSRFTTTVVFTLTSYDLLTGESFAPEEFQATGSGDSPEKSDREALAVIPMKMVYYIDNHFKYQTEILRIEAPNAKGKYKELYIRSGASMGVQNGDLFKVYERYEVAGTAGMRLIGKIRARQVCGEELTLCTFSNGVEAIVRAFSDGHELVVVSDGQALF